MFLTWDGKLGAAAATKMQAPLPVLASNGAQDKPPHISAMRLAHTPTFTRGVAGCAPAWLQSEALSKIVRFDNVMLW